MTNEEFIDKQQILLDRLPIEFHSEISYLAWERGHSGGYDDVLINLNDLVSALEKPIELFKKNLKNNS